MVRYDYCKLIIIKGGKKIETIINGGIYRVNFNGKSPQFIGTHPAIVLRTLKENGLYITIPLTTYTKERWEKTKKNGYGIRILETNSIAKIEKFIVVHKENIKNRWVDASSNNILILDPIVIEKLNEKLDKYINLTTRNLNKEYKKYHEKYLNVKLYFEKFCDSEDDDENIFEVENETSDFKMIKCKKKELHELSISDLKDIIKSNVEDDKFNILFKNDYIIIEISKTIPDKQKYNASTN